MSSTRKHVSIGLVVFLLVALPFIFTGCGKSQETGKENIKLKVADIYSNTHYISKGSVQVWMKRVTELTNGKVQFQYFPSEQIGKSADMLDVVSKGVADVGYVPFPYFSGRMPLITGAGAISGTWENCTAGNPAVLAIANSNPVLDHDFIRNGVRPMLPFANQTFQLLTNKKAIKTLEDVKGLKIRSSGGVMDRIIASFGAVPVQIPVPELYEALQKGTVDGVLISFVSSGSHKIDEVVKFATRGVNVSGGIFGYVISEKTWKTLSPDVQQAMLKAAQEATKNLGSSMDALEVEAVEKFKKKGVQIIDLSPEEQKRWVDVQKPVLDNWVKSMEEKQLPGRQVFDSLVSKVQETKKNSK